MEPIIEVTELSCLVLRAKAFPTERARMVFIHGEAVLPCNLGWFADSIWTAFIGCGGSGAPGVGARGLVTLQMLSLQLF